MNITTFTTEAEILAPIAAAKARLVEEATKAAASEFNHGQRLVGLAQNVASCEALAQAQCMYLRAIKADPASALFVLAEIALHIDDTSSGRGNDSRRSSHDAIVSWVRDEISSIKYGD